MYRTGGTVLCVFLLVGVGASLLLKFWLAKLNKQADERERERGILGEMRGFRYVL